MNNFLIISVVLLASVAYGMQPAPEDHRGVKKDIPPAHTVVDGEIEALFAAYHTRVLAEATVVDRRSSPLPELNLLAFGDSSKSTSSDDFD